MPSRWGQACHPADEESDNSLGSVTIAVGIGAAGHLLGGSRIVKEGTQGSENPLRVCAREARCAGSNGFRVFENFANYQNWLAQRGPLFLNPSGIGEQDVGALHAGYEGDVVQRREQPNEEGKRMWSPIGCPSST